MSDVPSPGDRPDDPFGGLPLFGDLARALAGQGPLNWEAARQFAQLGATGGRPEANVEPALRPAYADLARIAGMHVHDVSGSDVDFPEPELVTRGQWAQRTLDDYRPLFTSMATSLGAPVGDDTADDDPMAQMMAGLSKLMAPAMLGMTVGSMVGRLAQRSFGVHDLPIPRDRTDVLIVPTTVDEFAASWEIEPDEMRLWVLAHELCGYALFTVAHLREPLAELVRRHVGAFRPDPSAVADKLAGLDVVGDDPFQALQQAFGDPEVLLGAVRSPDQLALEPALDAAVATIVGYTDWVVDAVAVRVIGGDALRIAEAVRRRRVDTSPDDVFVERLLGIRLGSGQVARGKAFVQGVVDRAGEGGLAPLLTTPGSLPTPAEVDAPGLWIARVTGG
jgi:putative hydrolase